MKISYYSNGITQTEPDRQAEITEILADIKGLTLAGRTRELRAATAPEVQAVLKAALPYVTWSGAFSKRMKKDPTLKHSGLLCIDFDDLTELKAARRKIDADPYTLVAFTSPRGNGLKVVIQIPADPDTHEKSFAAAAAYYDKAYGLKADESGKDVSRACFLCHDPDLIYHEKAEIFDSMRELPVAAAVEVAGQAEIPAGQRHDTLRNIAIVVFRETGSLGAAKAAIEHENQTRCSPPKPPGELDAILAWIEREVKKPGTDEAHLTDLGLAQRFVQEHGDRLRYCHQLGSWLVWDGFCWETDDRDQVFQMAKQTVRGVYTEAAQCPNEQFRERLAKFAIGAESAQRINAFLTLAKRELTIPIADMDADPALLNCRTVVFNFRTGETLKPAPELLQTMATAAGFDPEAKCPLWEKTISEIFNGDENQVKYFQKATGAALLGENKERVAIIDYGEGANGKSVALNTIRKTLGSYATATPASTLMTKKSSNIPNDLAALRGKRFILASESDQNARISESTLKLLAGGSDLISARFLHQEFFSFKPTFLVHLMTNHRPRVGADDQAIWDRLRLIPFERRFEPGERNVNLEAQLEAELPGILGWLIRGAQLVAAEGLGENEKVARATAAYRADQDPAARFVADQCETDPAFSWQARPLFQQYVKWSQENREPMTLPQSRFAKALEKLGFKKEKIGGVVKYYGLKPIIDEEPEHEPPAEECF